MDFSNISNKKVLGIIPARGGEQEVPRKNIRPINNRTLLFYTIKHAQKCEFIDHLLVSTEDTEIADHARDMNCEVHKRPIQLAQKTSSMDEVILDVLVSVQKNNYSFDSFILLQPTSPYRTHEHIRKAWNSFQNQKEADTLYSVFPKDKSLCRIFRKDEAGFLVPAVDLSKNFSNRQDLPEVFMPNGAIFIQKVSTFLKIKKLCLGKIMPFIMLEEESMDIDALEDFEEAERVIQEENIHASIL